jgi:16S rRNA (cytidine1402-2'-O)-methyltransferase
MRKFDFYLVSTPIGNLDDMSRRAVEVLASVDIIYAEDTRKTRVLLRRFEISTPVRSYHDHNKERVAPAIISSLRDGKSVALVADAGTPLISDPGYYLMRRVLDEGITVTSVPGASAALSALVLSGFPPDRFTFFGYMPRKRGEREKVLGEARDNPGTSIFFESPHRLVKTLRAIEQLLGEREIAVARELTKLHEEIVRGTAAHCMAHFEERGVRGEITLVIRGTGKRRGRTKGNGLTA